MPPLLQWVQGMAPNPTTSPPACDHYLLRVGSSVLTPEQTQATLQPLPKLQILLILWLVNSVRSLLLFSLYLSCYR